MAYLVLYSYERAGTGCVVVINGLMNYLSLLSFGYCMPIMSRSIVDAVPDYFSNAKSTDSNQRSNRTRISCEDTSCLWSQRIFPSLPGSRLTSFLSRCKFSTLTTRQPMVEFYLLTFPRFPLRKKEHKSYFGKNRTHDFRTSRCAAYLLDHSGDDYVEDIYIRALSDPVSTLNPNIVFTTSNKLFVSPVLVFVHR